MSQVKGISEEQSHFLGPAQRKRAELVKNQTVHPHIGQALKKGHGVWYWKTQRDWEGATGVHSLPPLFPHVLDQGGFRPGARLKMSLGPGNPAIARKLQAQLPFPEMEHSKLASSCLNQRGSEMPFPMGALLQLPYRQQASALIWSKNLPSRKASY